MKKTTVLIHLTVSALLILFSISSGFAGGSRGGDPFAQKVLRFQERLTGVYLVPEFWGIPPELLVPFKKNLATSLQSEIDFRVGQKRVSQKMVQKSLSHAKIIALGDSHGDTDRHFFYADLIDSVARTSKEKWIATIEIIKPQDQALLDDFISGKMSVDELRSKIGYDQGEFSIYPFEGYRKILLALQKHRVKSLAVFRPEGVHYSNLRAREEFVYNRVQTELQKNKSARVFLLYGSWHFFGDYNLTDRFIVSYPTQMVHFFTGLNFPEIRMLLRERGSFGSTQKGVIFESKFKGVKTYYQKLGLNRESAGIGFKEYFEDTVGMISDEKVRENFAELEAPLWKDYRAVMDSLQAKDGMVEVHFAELCSKVKNLYAVSLPLLGGNPDFMSVFEPKLKALAACD